MSKRHKDARIKRAILKGAGGNFVMAAARAEIQAESALDGELNIAPNSEIGHAERRLRIAAELRREAETQL